MKKFLLSSVLLNVSLLMQGMESSNQLRVRMGGYSGHGQRQNQEDRFVCGVIKQKNDEIYCTLIADGHGGDKVACLLQARFLPFVQKLLGDDKSIKEALFNARIECEKLALQEDNYKSSGSTLLASCFNPKNKKLHVLWVGDSRAAFGGVVFYPTYDHVPTESAEKERIENVGGVISDTGRLHGIIGVSRSIGDKLFKDRYKSLISDPDYVEYEMKTDDDFYIGASDGFWDVVTNEEIANLIKDAQSLSQENFYQTHCTNFDKNNNNFNITMNNHNIDLNNDFENKDAARIARRLLHIALYRGSKDNITVVVKFFGDKEFAVQSASESDENRDISEEDSIVSENDLDGLKSLDRASFLGNVSDGLEELKKFFTSESGCNSGIENLFDGEDRGSGDSEEVIFSGTEKDKKSNSSESSSELESFEFSKRDSTIKPVDPQASWKVFIENHKFRIGVCMTAMLAIIIAAYKYNYLHLNYMAA